MVGLVGRIDERSPTVRPSSPNVQHGCFCADNRHNGANGPVVGNTRAGRPTAVVRALCPACHLVRYPGGSWPHDGRDGVDPLRDTSSSRPNETTTVRTFERRMYVRGGLAPEISSSAVHSFLDRFPNHSPNDTASLLHLLQRQQIPLRCGPSIRPFLAPSRSISRRSRVRFERISPWHHLFPPIFPAAAVLGHLLPAGGLETTATAHLVSDCLPSCCIRFVSLTSSGSLSSSYRSPTQPHGLPHPFCPAPTRITSSAPTACLDPLDWDLCSSVGFACDGRGGGVPFGDPRREFVHWDRGPVTSTRNARQLRRSTTFAIGI